MLFKFLVAGFAYIGTNASPTWDSSATISPSLEDRSALIEEKAPLHLLLPRHHPDHEAHDHAHLELHMSKHLFFGQEHPKRECRVYSHRR